MKRMSAVLAGVVLLCATAGGAQQVPPQEPANQLPGDLPAPPPNAGAGRPVPGEPIPQVNPAGPLPGNPVGPAPVNPAGPPPLHPVGPGPGNPAGGGMR